jgi:hypothetical protein
VRRLHGKVVPASRAAELAGFSFEWSRDDAADLHAGRVAAGDFADPVKPVGWDHLFVRRDLQHRISRRVENRLAGEDVFFAEFLENGSAAARVVADEFHTGFAFDAVDELVRESLEDGERLVEHHTRQLPMAGRRVFAR